ncbi:MAG: hypothetical protein BV459_07940, partial [Thermoplasmata archaeon M11B2D]
MDGETMKTIKEGDTVQIVCVAKLENGELCYKTDTENHIELVIGEGTFFPIVEKALEQMAEGQSKTITLEAEDAFGPHIDDL